jgi:hypothetical protein
MSSNSEDIFFIDENDLLDDSDSDFEIEKSHAKKKEYDLNQSCKFI